jgi:predicted  nucleic acid-binding Zn-ribbon protein
MTALENSAVGFIKALIDTLQAMEKDRDTWKERCGKAQDQLRTAEDKIVALEETEAGLRRAATEAYGCIEALKREVEELKSVKAKKR